MTKPKGKTPSLLSMSSGKPVLHECGRACKCSRCKNGLSKGVMCFQIPKSSSGFTAKKIHCLDCTASVIAQTKKDILKIEKEIETLS
ncbi:MAG: hypothetical protein Hals2KO_14570 [Halioglobus sp.]